MVLAATLHGWRRKRWERCMQMLDEDQIHAAQSLQIGRLMIVGRVAKYSGDSDELDDTSREVEFQAPAFEGTVSNLPQDVWEDAAAHDQPPTGLARRASEDEVDQETRAAAEAVGEDINLPAQNTAEAAVTAAQDFGHGLHHDQAAHVEYAYSQDEYDEQDYGGHPEDDAEPPPPADLYMIVGILKDCDGAIEEVLLNKLDYQHFRADASAMSFSFCGGTICGYSMDALKFRGDSVKLTDLLDSDN